LIISQLFRHAAADITLSLYAYYAADCLPPRFDADFIAFSAVATIRRCYASFDFRDAADAATGYADAI